MNDDVIDAMVHAFTSATKRERKVITLAKGADGVWGDPLSLRAYAQPGMFVRTPYPFSVITQTG